MHYGYVGVGENVRFRMKANNFVTAWNNRLELTSYRLPFRLVIINTAKSDLENDVVLFAASN